MSQQTFKVHFVLITSKTNKKGESPIYARVRINGSKIEISTKRNVSKDNWSLEGEKLVPANTSNKEVNQYLDNLKSKIYNAYNSLLSSGESVSVHSLRDALFGGPVVKKHTLIEATREHNNQFEAQIGIKYSQGSYKNYKTTLKYLVEFIPLLYKKQDLPLDLVNYEFCDRFFTFLTTHKNCLNNGANKQIQRVKKIINYSLRRGFVKINHMATYSLKFAPYKRTALTMDEISKIQYVSIGRATLAEVRDIFIFQCYTGLSYSDIKDLHFHHLLKDENESWWIKMERKKTGVSFSVPILRPAALLLELYLSKERGSRIFPVLSNQKMNENLKVIQEIAQVKKNLTTHLARHSFATTITLNNDVPIETVSRMLGHTTIRTTQLYAKVLDAKVGLDMQKLSLKINAKN